jgi:hypothetical protein
MSGPGATSQVSALSPTAGLSDSSYPLTAWGYNDLLNACLALEFAANPGLFAGSQSAPALFLDCAYAATAAPTVQLGPVGGSTPPAANLAITLPALDLKFYDLQQGTRGALQLEQTCTATIYGALALVGGSLTLTALLAELQSDDRLGDQLIQRLLNAQLRKSAQTIQLPQLQLVFGSGLRATVQSATVQQTGSSSPYLYLMASLGSASATAPTGTSTAPAPHPAAPRPAGATATSGVLYAAVSNAAVNALLPTLMPSPFYYNPPQQTSDSVLGFAGGARASFTMQVPTVSMSGSVTATTRVSTNAQVGFVTPFSGWDWISVPVPDVTVTVNAQLGVDGSGKWGLLTLTGIGSPQLVLDDWPSVVPDEVKDWIQALFSALVSEFVQAASQMVQGIRIPLFQLPNTVPGTSIPASLSFTGPGLQASNGYLLAEIAVSGG